MKYSTSGGKDMIEIVIRDFSGARLQTFKCNNQESYSKVLRIIRDKYGYDFVKKNTPRDLEWLNKR